MQPKIHNGDSRGITAAVPDSLIAAIHELRQRPRSQWLDLARTDQSQRWRRRSGVPSELYLSLLPEMLADEEEALVLIGGEIHLRHETGEHPTVEEYQRRFPQLSSAIALQFDFVRIFETAEEPAATNDIGTSDIEISGYEILERIGSGSSGAVYRAIQKSLKRIVAIKVCSVRGAEPKTLARLHQEAEILARLNHPHIVQVYEVARSSDYLCLVMEFVDGPNLQEYAAGRPLPAGEAARRGLILAEAIERVHESGVLHRDLKPSNILVSGDGQLKITDFGLAKLRSSDNLLTTADTVLGTPSYMAPEQATGAAHAVGPEADVYSLGAILYELITGRPPFLGSTVLDTLSQIRQLDAAPPRNLQPTTPRDLETISLKCLEKDPKRRYSTAAALVADLQRYLDGVPIHARRPSRTERIGRWLRRNPLASALTAALLLTITAGFAVSLWQWRQAKATRHEADQRIVQLQDAVHLVDRSRQFRGRQNLDDALECLDEAVRLRPEYRDAWEERGRFHGSFGLWGMALADRRVAMKLAQPSHSFDWWDYAVLLAHAGEHEHLGHWSAQMRARFHGATREHLLAVVRTSCLMSSVGTDYEKLVKLLLLEMAEDTAFPLNTYVLGLAYYRAGQFDQAIKWCRKSVELSQKSQSPWCYGLNDPVLALAHGRLGQTKDAENSIVSAKRWENHWTQQLYDSATPHGLYQQGALAWPLLAAHWLEFQTLLREARQQRGENLTSVDSRWQAIRARSLAALGRFDEAVQEFRSALELSPDDAPLTVELHRSRAMAAVQRADYSQAATEFGNASRLVPDDALLCQYHAQAYLFAGNPNAYRRACREMLRKFAATQDPETAARVVHTCTQQADSLPNRTELLPLSKVAARAWPGGEWLIGATCVRTGDYTEAIRCFQQAEIRHVPRPRDMCFKAIAYHHLGQMEQSRRFLQEARDWMRRADRERLPLTDVSNPSWGPWYEPAESKLLLAEAEAVLSKPAANVRD